VAWDTTLGWRYPNPRLEQLFPLETMGETAENICTLAREGKIAGGEISRVEQDRFALQSHTRAVAALNSGAFAGEIVPVPVPQPKGSPLDFAVDELAFARRSEGGAYELTTSLGQLAQLKPAFRKEGSVTAGNSSSLNDGASALVLMSAQRATALGLKPLAAWMASAAAGVDPRVMGLGPVAAVRRLLERTGLNVHDLELVELNEAFAAQALAVIRELGLNEATTNVHGGAIALGHPLGCSGARLVVTLVHALRRRPPPPGRERYALATLCVGVGQGEATLLRGL
jgi:acetyl-CoA C-acetyltransferase